MKEKNSKNTPGQEFDKRISERYTGVACPAFPQEYEITEDRYQIIPAQLFPTGRAVGSVQGN